MSEKGPVEEYERKKKDIERVLETTNTEFSRAYLLAADTHLFDKDKGGFDHDRLKGKDGAELRKAMAKTISGHLLEKAKDYFGAKAENDVAAQRLLQQYAGVTSQKIEDLIEHHKEDYKLDTHEKYRDKFMEGVEKEIAPIASSHLNNEHIDDFVNKMSDFAKKRLDTKYMQIGQIIPLYHDEKKNGPLTDKRVQQLHESISKAPKGENPQYLKKE